MLILIFFYFLNGCEEDYCQFVFTDNSSIPFGYLDVAGHGFIDAPFYEAFSNEYRGQEDYIALKNEINSIINNLSCDGQEGLKCISQTTIQDYNQLLSEFERIDLSTHDILKIDFILSGTRVNAGVYSIQQNVDNQTIDVYMQVCNQGGELGERLLSLWIALRIEEHSLDYRILY